MQRHETKASQQMPRRWKRENRLREFALYTEKREKTTWTPDWNDERGQERQFDGKDSREKSRKVQKVTARRQGGKRRTSMCDQKRSGTQAGFMSNLLTVEERRPLF